MWYNVVDKVIFVIRNLSIEDIEEIVKDEERIFGDSLGKSMLEASVKGDDVLNHYFVLDDNGIRGYIGIWVDGVNAQILNFYVKEEYRRCHHGEELVNFAVEYAKELGVTTISLEVRPHNLAAVDLYLKLGFEYSYKRKYFYNDGEDAHVYIKYL